MNPEDIGKYYESILDKEARKEGGIYYTPSPIVDYMVENSVGELLKSKTPAEAAKLKIVDPACGGGVFLLEVYQLLLDWHKKHFGKLTPAKRRKILTDNIFGVDIDPLAVAITKYCLAMKCSNDKDFSLDLDENIRCGDSLIDTDCFDWQRDFSHVFQQGGFDAVLGNPPYVDSETMVATNLQKRELYASLYTSTVGNWDLFVPFVENGINLVDQHGIVSFIIPNKIISQDYAASIREIISNYRLIEIRDYSRQNVFPIADVYPVTIVLKKESVGFFEIKMTTMRTTVEIERTNIVSNKIMDGFQWDIFFCTPELTSILIKIANSGNTFRNMVNFYSPCTVEESYKIKTFLSDSAVTSDSKKLINSGTIDKYVSKWGVRNTTYIKGQYLYPIVSNESLKSMNNNRYRQSSESKIIVANMTTVLEAFFDAEAEYLAGKSTVIGIGDYQNMLFLTGLLNSKLISIWYQSVYHSTKMSGGALSVTADRINQIPIPNVSRDNQRPIIALVDKILSAKKTNPSADTTEWEQKIDSLVYKLYGLTKAEIVIVEG